MNADCFTYSAEPYYMSQVFNLFGYSYNELKKVKEKEKYSRGEILKTHIDFKGNVDSKTKLELEDYLRNDLLTNYITPNKSKFDLNYFHFVAGADEIRESVTVGSLDIKVLFPTTSYMSEGEYFAIECKRVNKLKFTKDYYVDHGINRFITRQYYPETSVSVAWMLSFMECKKDSQKENSSSLISSFNSILDLKYKKNVLYEIGEKKIEMKLDYKIDVYNSSIIRSDKTELQVYHVFLDYYNLIDP